jgi:hypothetical protein
MGCDMRDFRDAKTMAQSLRRALSDKSVKLTHSDCLELISKSFGLDNWNVLAAKIDAARPAPDLAATQSKDKTLYCSFCGKPQQEVATLIAGPPPAMICNECVGLCDSILFDKTLGKDIEAAMAREPGRDAREITVELLRTYGDDRVRTCLRSSQDWLEHIEQSLRQVTVALSRRNAISQADEDAKPAGGSLGLLLGKPREEVEAQKATLERTRAEVSQRVSLVAKVLEERGL